MSDESSWDWNKALPMWTWHQFALDGFPSWEKPNGTLPASVFISVEHSKDRGSREIAIETDDWCKGAFYYRDFTKSGTPFVRDGDVYNSRFWFQFQSDAQEFARRYGGEMEAAECQN